MKNAAFTLIELSIVLVIIGLIAGGVLVGKDLIRSAEISKIYRTVEQYKTATYAFKNKYGGYPGDISNATSFFSGAVNGNNNGIINSQAESRQFWYQLGKSGLISGDYDGVSGIIVPGRTLPADKKVGYDYRCTQYIGYEIFTKSMCYFVAANFEGLDFDWAGYGITTPIESRLLDEKYDDGIPSSGKIWATRQSNTTAGVCTDTNAYYSTDAVGAYVSNNNLECVLLFPFNF